MIQKYIYIYTDNNLLILLKLPDMISLYINNIKYLIAYMCVNEHYK